MKIHNRILTLTIIYFVLIAFLSGFGPLSFGAGLGDLAYLFLIILWIIVLGTYFLIIRLKNIVLKPIVSRLMIAVMIGSCLYITLEFTYLRDGLYPWNGRIFMISHEEQLYMEKEQINSKIDSLEQAVRANPDDYQSQTRQGYLLNEIENWDRAIEKFNKAIETNPRYFDSFYGLGESYCGKAQYVLAVRAFEQAKSIDATREGVSARIVNLKAAHRIRE
jgi:tetratricopeptide (TPR) repeat protein